MENQFGKDEEKDQWDLSEENQNEIKRRIHDLEDPTRFVITSTLLGHMYYNLSEDCWSSTVDYATKFKRKRHAKVILRLNGDNKDKWHKIETLYGKNREGDKS